MNGMIVISCIYFSTIRMLSEGAAYPLRRKRDVTPTMYPTPPVLATSRHVTSLSSNQLASAVLSSSPVTCPVKRDVRTPRVLLTPELMKLVYLGKVGQWDSRYVAESYTEADKHFLDLVATRNNGDLSDEPDRMPQETKGQIRKDMRNLRKWLAEFIYQQDKTTGSANNSAPNDLQLHTRNAMTVIMRMRCRSTIDKILRENNITQSMVSANINASLPLETLRNMYQPRNRVKRATDGSRTSTAYCLARGSATGDGYLHMCSKCALTTVLPADRFPRYINEASCDTADCDCLTVKSPYGPTTVHGKCRPTTIYIKMLKRQASGCRLVISNGQQVITDDWVLYNQKIRTGCECVIDKRSAFASYIPNSAVG